MTAAVHMIVEAVFWFYPPVWWIGARVIEERERVCDETVPIVGNEPREHANAILNVYKHYVKSLLVCVSGIGSDLKRRIVRIMARRIGQGLTLGRKLLLGGAAAVAIAIPLALGMTGASKGGTQGAEATNGRLPSFEAASIKLEKSHISLASRRLFGRYYSASSNVTGMIMHAYGQYMKPLSTDQVLGGPAWIRTDFYHINARVSDSIVNGEWKKLSFAQRWNQAMLMLRSLLTNRFKLRVRHEKKVLPVFELVLAKNGPEIAEDKTAERSCRITGLGPGKGFGFDVKSCHLNDFVWLLSHFPDVMGRVLVDKTGLHGRYSFKIHWTREIPAGMLMRARGSQRNHSAVPSESSGPSLFTALREQLGLKLVPGKAPEDVIVIEHIERPSPN
jgi:bla regulator protein blaR1